MWFVIVDQLRNNFGYSTNAACLRASFPVSALAMLLMVDKPFSGFWYRTGLLGIFICKYSIYNV